jgi:hypothetical protein
MRPRALAATSRHRRASAFQPGRRTFGRTPMPWARDACWCPPQHPAKWPCASRRARWSRHGSHAAPVYTCCTRALPVLHAQQLVTRRAQARRSNPLACAMHPVLPRIHPSAAQSRPIAPAVATGRSSPVCSAFHRPSSSPSTTLAPTRTPCTLPCTCNGRPTRLLAGIAVTAADRRHPHRRPSPEPSPAKPTPPTERG